MVQNVEGRGLDVVVVLRECVRGWVDEKTAFIIKPRASHGALQLSPVLDLEIRPGGAIFLRDISSVSQEYYSAIVYRKNTSD